MSRWRRDERAAQLPQSPLPPPPPCLPLPASVPTINRVPTPGRSISMSPFSETPSIICKGSLPFCLLLPFTWTCCVVQYLEERSEQVPTEAIEMVCAKPGEKAAIVNTHKEVPPADLPKQPHNATSLCHAWRRRWSFPSMLSLETESTYTLLLVWASSPSLVLSKLGLRKWRVIFERCAVGLWLTA